MQVKAGNKTYQLWFNNYAMMEIASVFGIEQKEILKVCQEKLKDNFLILVGDLFYAGYKGAKLAKGEGIDLKRADVSGIVAIGDMEDLMQVWEVFRDINGLNQKESSKNKKKAGAKKKTPSPKKKS